MAAARRLHGPERGRAALIFTHKRDEAAIPRPRRIPVASRSVAKATFCPKDSFETCVTENMFCTYQTFAALVLWADKDMFEKLVDAILYNTKYTADKGDGSGNHIIEAHIFSPIEFSKDVDRILISLDEIGQVKPPLTAADIYANLGDVAVRNNIRVQYF